MDFIEKEYQLWKQYVDDPALKKELQAMEMQPKVIQESFFTDLGFGTGGMRGLMGAGPNRMNIYTVRKASQGLANFLKNTALGEKKAVIAYDSRHMSWEFALEAALVLAKNDIKTYLFTKITPTPILSYAVRELGCKAGIVVTASHNSKEYNGYKVYDQEGGQVTDHLADAITAEIKKLPSVFNIETLSQYEAENKGLLVFIQDEIMQSYLKLTKSLIFNPEFVKAYASELKIVYTPLHGSGLIPITELLKQTGFSGVHLVQKQISADPNFSTVVCPNPEEPAACKLAIVDAYSLEADLVLLTDPDADRIGVVVRNMSGEYVQLTGNQIGALLIDYILQMRKTNGTLPDDGVIVKTIVTSDMGAEIAKHYGVKTINVLTGFKYIGEKIVELEKSKESHYIFGYEESFGYLAGTHVHDKDAIQSALLLAEMALYHKKNSSSIYQRLQELFEKFGYYSDYLINMDLQELDGQKKIALIMDGLRQGPPLQLKHLEIIIVRDYLLRQETNYLRDSVTDLTLPVSNVLYFSLAKGSWCCIRPSGTEPKLKIYLSVCARTLEASQTNLEELKQAVMQMLASYTEL